MKGQNTQNSCEINSLMISEFLIYQISQQELMTKKKNWILAQTYKVWVRMVVDQYKVRFYKNVQGHQKWPWGLWKGKLYVCSSKMLW